MSIKVMSLIWDVHGDFLTGIEKAILLRLADFGADNGTQIYPGHNRLAQDTGFSKSTVIRTITSLEEKKVLFKTTRKKKTHYITNLYRINIKLIESLANQQSNPLPPKGSKKVSYIKKRVVDKSQRVVSQRHQGSVTVTLGGSVTVTPKPSSTKPLLKPSEETPVNNFTEPKEIPLSKEDDVFLKKEMLALAFTLPHTEQLIHKYGSAYLCEILNMTRERAKSNPRAYFLKLLEKKAATGPRIGFNKAQTTKAGYEPCKAVIEADKRLELANSPEARKVGALVLKELVEKMRA